MKAAPSDPTIPYVVMTTSNLDSLELPQTNKYHNKKHSIFNLITVEHHAIRCQNGTPVLSVLQYTHESISPIPTDTSEMQDRPPK